MVPLESTLLFLTLIPMIIKPIIMIIIIIRIIFTSSPGIATIVVFMVIFIISIFINLVFIYIVLRSSVWIEKKLGNAGTQILRKIFGVILIAIAIKIFKSRLM